jgi:AraC-like DNA-binding protein
VWRHPGFDGMIFHRGCHATHPYPRHWHDELHLCAYTEGAGYLRCRGTTRLACAGDLVLTPPSEVHDNWVVDGSVSFASLYITEAALDQLAFQVTGRHRAQPDLTRMFRTERALKRSFLRFYSAMEAQASQLECEESLFDFIYVLLAPRASSCSAAANTERECAAVRLAREYLSEHWSESISLADLSTLVDLSPFHLHRLFTRQIGIPPHAYQTQLRINRTKQLLRSGHALAEIAAMTGFADQSHLTRHFHRLVGVTPGRYAFGS